MKYKSLLFRLEFVTTGNQDIKRRICVASNSINSTHEPDAYGVCRLCGIRPKNAYKMLTLWRHK